MPKHSDKRKGDRKKGDKQNANQDSASVTKLWTCCCCGTGGFYEYDIKCSSCTQPRCTNCTVETHFIINPPVKKSRKH
ncbi:hypothetical protein VTK73DRAFT_1191 [Phialemonium thermophilum]|uniref:Uncharacterized protein n=1 Tax=Phialemonium thermophilum TaxID=223376 RepID=A0ABR3XAT8_9PEZI